MDKNVIIGFLVAVLIISTFSVFALLDSKEVRIEIIGEEDLPEEKEEMAVIADQFTRIAHDEEVIIISGTLADDIELPEVENFSYEVDDKEYVNVSDLERMEELGAAAETREEELRKYQKILAEEPIVMGRRIIATEELGEDPVLVARRNIEEAEGLESFKYGMDAMVSTRGFEFLGKRIVGEDTTDIVVEKRTERLIEEKADVGLGERAMSEVKDIALSPLGAIGIGILTGFVVTKAIAGESQM